VSALGEGFRSPSGQSRNRPHGNLAALRIAVILMFGVLAAQLFNMQIIQGSDYARRSRENHLTRKEILPPRGLILDRNGTPLVKNVGIYTATITPTFLPEDANARYALYLRLEQLLGVPALEIQSRVKEKETDGKGDIEFPIKEGLTKEQALALEELTADMTGVALTIQPGREYIAGDAFSHILGYIGKQTPEEYRELRTEGYSLNEPVGKGGVELTYQAVLRGEKGATAAEQDAQGHLLKALKSRDAVPGSNVRLAIDSELQTYIAEMLEASLPNPVTMNQKNATTAAAVVMSAKTGEVLALVSVPSYDNNIFAQVTQRGAEYEALATDNKTRPLTNKALSQALPGSTYKLITAAAALQEGNITPATSRDIPSRILEIKGENGVIYNLIDWRAHGSGIDLTQAIAWSSNIYMFMAVCGIPNGSLQPHKALGKDVDSSASIFAYYQRGFGMGQATGIDIPGEDTGRVPDPAWKARNYAGPDYTDNDRDWYYADTCFTAIGQQDVLATPIQIARMTAAVATGKLFTPHVAKDILDADGKVIKTIKPEWKSVPVDEANLAAVRRGMHESVLAGAGAKAQVSGMDIAGKTGTAEFGTQRPDGSYDQHAWFTGYYPYNDPEYVVTVYFDYGVGGDKAAPAAANIFSWMNQNLGK